jgi:RNA polymerase sigma-70 factor (ECF subfamily)
MVASEDPRTAVVHDLVRLARLGDDAAFRRLVEMYMRAVYSVAYRLMGDHDDADDVAQETFVRAHQSLSRYDESYSFYTWLRTIATRLGLNELEKRRRRKTHSGETFDTAAESVPAAAPDAADVLAGEELREALEQALGTLTEEYRAVLVLRTYEDLSYEEIAHTLGIPIGTVMSRLCRARGLLRQVLEAQAKVDPKSRKLHP